MSKRNFLAIIEKCNNFLLPGSSMPSCIPFLVEDKQVGLVRPDILTHLMKYTDAFTTVSIDGTVHSISLSNELKTCQERSEKIKYVLEDLKQQNNLVTLRGWRNETFDVRSVPSEKPLMQVERSGICLFGAISYGVHVNGYTYKDNQLMMWIGQRSPTKQTYPNLLDNMAAGGLASGLKVRDCAVKECQEEASIPVELTNKLVPVGCLSYIFEDQRGIFPECEYVFDIELPSDFVPVNADGEVGNFQLMDLDQVMDAIISKEFKPNSSLITLEFLIRHGIITAEKERNYAYLVEMMHVPLQSYFSKTRQLLSK